MKHLHLAIIALVSGLVLTAHAAAPLGGDAGPHIIEHLVKLISTDINSELLATFFSRESL